MNCINTTEGVTHIHTMPHTHTLFQSSSFFDTQFTVTLSHPIQAALMLRNARIHKEEIKVTHSVQNYNESNERTVSARRDVNA